MNVIIDLVRDWEEMMIKEMKSKGLRFSNSTRKSLLVIRYFTYLRKLGGPTLRSRKIHFSREFSCPSQYKPGLDKITARLKEGKDLSPFLSKRVDNMDIIDGMFNDWGVLHLHLGKEFNTRGYVERTGPLLFLYLTDSDAYLINIYEHGDWAKNSILQTLYNNWPVLLAPYIVPEAVGLTNELTENELVKSRNSGSFVLIQVKDANGANVVLIPPSFGMATSRDANLDIHEYDNVANALKQAERAIINDEQLVSRFFHGNLPEKVNLRLIYNDHFSIIELSTKREIVPDLFAYLTSLSKQKYPFEPQ